MNEVVVSLIAIQSKFRTILSGRSKIFLKNLRMIVDCANIEDEVFKCILVWFSGICDLGPSSELKVVRQSRHKFIGNGSIG